MTKRDMILKRKRNDKYTTSNEPLIGYQENDSIITQYPDMYKAYMDFSNTYSIPTDNFVLTNGTEESLRICLSVIRKMYDEYREFCYMDNGWGLTKIIAEQEGFYPKELKSTFENEEYEQVIENKKLYNFPERIFYYAPISNIFKQNIDEEKVLSIPSNVVIRDEVYTSKTLLKPIIDLPEGLFVIGSYSKALGCGIRLGYILYNSAYDEYFQHDRPNYISPLAAMHTKICLPSYETRMEHMRELEEERDEYFGKGLTTPNYITIKECDYNGDKERIDKRATIDGVPYVRLGMMK